MSAFPLGVWGVFPRLPVIHHVPNLEPFRLPYAKGQAVNIVVKPGHRSGALKVVERAPSDGGRVMWFCICRCGKRVAKRGKSLRDEHVKFCASRCPIRKEYQAEAKRALAALGAT
jgi:hypothetical protein